MGMALRAHELSVFHENKIANLKYVCYDFLLWVFEAKLGTVTHGTFLSFWFGCFFE